jgi:hypothetical protein
LRAIPGAEGPELGLPRFGELARGEDRGQLTGLGVSQQPGRRGQDCPAGPGQLRCLDLPLEHIDLITQDKDLGVLCPGPIGRMGGPGSHL